MFLVNCVILLIYLMLAIISRKHFSKYKDKQVKGGFVAVVFLSMGKTIYRIVNKYISMDRIKNRLRKIQVVSKETLQNLAEEYVVKNAATALFVMFICSAISLSVCILYDMRAEDASNIIEREDYSGDAIKHDIYLTVDGQTSVYELEVMPTEYTEQQFLQEAQNVNEWLSTEILGNNSSADCITEDLNLPEKDKTNCFDIMWKSDNPELVTSYGKVEWDLLTEDVVVVMSATITYLDYSVDYDYPLYIRAYLSEEDKKLSMVQTVLKEIEGRDRTQSQIVLPSENQNVKITLPANKQKASYKWIFLGALLGVVVVVLQRYQLEQSVKKRDNELNVMYSGFVSRICMLLGTGLTLRGAMEWIAYEMNGHSTLKQELLYMVHEQKMGRDEAATYESFATRIGLPIYARLMNHINQNLRVGTQNLIHVLEEEVGISLEMRNEYMKKRGEEVSTKLLFPMMVLLLVVMFIIMLPAIQNF